MPETYANTDSLKNAINYSPKTSVEIGIENFINWYKDYYTNHYQNGENWTNNTGWNGAAGTECDWYGITCSSGRVTKIKLGWRQLTGSIPAELGSLTELESLILSSNSLSGSIPSELGNLTNLEGLYLNSNSLTGSVPAELGNLTNLSELRLSNNNFDASLSQWLFSTNISTSFSFCGSEISCEFCSNGLGPLWAIMVLLILIPLAID